MKISEADFNEIVEEVTVIKYFAKGNGDRDTLFVADRLLTFLDRIKKEEYKRSFHRA